MDRHKRNVMVFASHPDDEILGCGGTIATHAQNGDNVHIVILAEGITGRDDKRNRVKRAADLSRLAESAREAAHILGAKSIKLNDFPDNRMDSVDLLEVIKVVESEINSMRPEIVYTHHYGDVNIDHKIVHDAVVTACRPLPNHFVKALLFFEVPSNTEWQSNSDPAFFKPNWFVDIDETLKLKIRALKAYSSEMRRWPHPRSYKAVEALARWRGATAGMGAAEAFMLGRLLRRSERAIPL